jgi:hypothetical protein
MERGMKEVVRRGFVHVVEHIEGECAVRVAFKPKPGESGADWIIHTVCCTEAEADLFREGQPVVLTLELDLS